MWISSAICKGMLTHREKRGESTSKREAVQIQKNSNSESTLQATCFKQSVKQAPLCFTAIFGFFAHMVKSYIKLNVRLVNLE